MNAVTKSVMMSGTSVLGGSSSAGLRICSKMFEIELMLTTWNDVHGGSSPRKQAQSPFCRVGRWRGPGF